MKKVLLLVFLCLCMTGCSTEETLETIMDAYDVSVISPVQRILVSLPDEAVQEAVSGGDGSELYF